MDDTMVGMSIAMEMAASLEQAEFQTNASGSIEPSPAPLCAGLAPDNRLLNDPSASLSSTPFDPSSYHPSMMLPRPLPLPDPVRYASSSEYTILPSLIALADDDPPMSANPPMPNDPAMESSALPPPSPPPLPVPLPIPPSNDARALKTRHLYPLAVRQMVVQQHQQGMSCARIAEALGMPVASVQLMVKRAVEQNGSVVMAERTGRPRVTTEATDQLIAQWLTDEPRITATAIQQRLTAEHHTTLSLQTIQRRMKEVQHQPTMTNQRMISIQQICSTQAQTDALEPATIAPPEAPAATAPEPSEPPQPSASADAPAPDTLESPEASEALVPKSMKKHGKYTVDMRQLIVRMHTNDGLNYAQIAARVNVPAHTVRHIVRKASSITGASSTGRPRHTSELIDLVILQTVRANEVSSAPKIQQQLEQTYQIKVSAETIRRRVKEFHKRRQTHKANGDETVADMLPVHVPVPVPSEPVSQPITDANELDKTTTTTKKKYQDYSLELRQLCLAKHKEGLTFREIGKLLQMPYTTVRAIVHKVKATGTFAPAKKSGRPKKTSEQIDRLILQCLQDQPRSSAKSIQAFLQTQVNLELSTETIRRRVQAFQRQRHLHTGALEDAD